MGNSIRKLDAAKPSKRLKILLFGEFRILCDEVPRELPKSRKTRALLAYLALAGRRQRRDALCELFWDVPNDPRAALRWSLSKLRTLLEVNGGSALLADSDSVGIDATQVSVDVMESNEFLAGDIAQLSDGELIEWDGQFAKGYLQGLERSDSIDYQMWLESERAQLDRCYAQVLMERVRRLAGLPDQALAIARKWIALNPLDVDANASLLRLTLKVKGHQQAHACLDESRARFQKAGLADAALIAAWQHLITENKKLLAASQSITYASLDEETRVIALPDKPSVAVLGFLAVGGHEDGGVLAEGLATDLSSRLSRLRGLFVTARASAARFLSSDADLKEVGRKLGVRYIISGTSQRLDKHIRVTISLVDAPNNEQIWSERFERSFDDLFLVQDDITSAIVSTVEPEIERAEMDRARAKTTENLSAWECYHRALWHCFRFTSRDAELAHGFLFRALEMDPDFARAYAGLSFTHYSRAFLNAVPDTQNEIQKALDYARQSLDLDGRDYMSHWSLGRGLFLSQQHDEALHAVERSLEINLNFAQGHYVRGFIGVHSGITQEAVSALDMAQRLSPFDPLLFAMKASRGVSLAINGNTEEAADLMLRASHEPNAHFHIYALAAACLELAHRHDEAQKQAKRALNMHPAYSISVYQRSFPFRIQAHQQCMVEAMLRAGIPS